MEKNTSSAYRTYGFEKIKAPNPKKNEQKSSVITGKSDLRGGKK